MSPDEAVKLLAVARAAYPGMSLVEGMPQVWHGALGDLQYGECTTAIVEHSKESTQIVTVADIRRIVQTSRRTAAGEERQAEIEARRPSHSQELVPMPDWFRSTVEEHRRRARAARKQAEDAGDPVTFGSHIVSALDGMRRRPDEGRSW